MKRLLLIAVLIVAMAQCALAANLTVQASSFNWSDGNTVGLELWVFSSIAWVDENGEQHGAGNPEDSIFTQRVSGVTNNTTTHRLSIPSFTLVPTRNAIRGATVRLSFWIMRVSGSRATAVRQVPGTENGLTIPTSIISATIDDPLRLSATFADLITYNSPSPALPVDGYYTRSEITRLLGATVGGVPATRQILTTAPLTGGGDLSASRTLALADTAVTPGAYTNANITVDAKGRITVAANGSTGLPGGSTGQLQVNSTGAFAGLAGSSFVGSALSLTGNLTAPLIDAGGQVFDVLAAPNAAVCDGVTDDAAAFNVKSLAASAAGGGRLYLPHRTTPCMIGSPILLGANVSLEGAGKGASTLKRKVGLTAGGVVAVGAKARITGVTIDGNYPATAGHSDAEIVITGDDAEIDHIEIKNASNIGIAPNAGVDGARIHDNLLTGSNDPSVGSIAIWFAATSVSGFDIYANTIRDWRLGAFYMGGNSQSVHDNLLVNNHRQVAPTGGGQIAAGAAGTFNVYNNRIYDGGGSLTSGIEVDNGFWSLRGNDIQNNPLYGIIVQGGTDIVLVGERIQGSTYGLVINAGITGGVIVNNLRAKGNSQYGVYVNAGADNLSLNDSDLRGNTVGALFDASIGSNKIIAGNLPLSINSGTSGTVTSVAMTVPSFLSVAGSPITSSGTLAVTLSGTALPVANGGTGDASLTAFALVAGGTTSTGPLQSLAGVGTSGQVLTSNGAGALPSFQTVSGTGTVTSVAATVPAFLSISGSPITTNGTLAFTLSGTALPTTSGGTGLNTIGTANQVLGANSGATALEYKSFAVGSTGTDVDFAHSANTITLNVPSASTLNRGVVTIGSQTFAGAKTFSATPVFSTMTAGSVLFAGAAGVLSQNNANFFWDNSTGFLGIGTNTPARSLHIKAGGNAGFRLDNGSAVFFFYAGSFTTGFGIYDENAASERFSINAAGITSLHKGGDIASAAAITLTGNTQVVTGSVTITSIVTTGIVAGTQVTLILSGTAQITDGGNLVMAGNFTGGANRTITFVYSSDGNFYEVSRSTN